MPFSNLSNVARHVADFVDDATVTAATEAYLHCLSVPGPVLVIVGASGRGKSTLFAHITGCVKPEEGTGVTIAGEATWDKVSDFPFRCIVERAALSVVPKLLVCDTPALDNKSQRQILEQIVEYADIVLFVLQVTQPTGVEEVLFAQRILCNKPAVLVITKMDLADEEDFDEAHCAIQSVYTGVPWLRIVAAGMDIEGEQLYGLQTFGAWWQREGGNVVNRLHKARIESLHHQWLNTALHALAVRKEHLATELEQVRFISEQDDNLQQAMELQTTIHDRIAELSRQATQQYTSRFPELRAQIEACADRFLETAKIGNRTDTKPLGAAIKVSIAEWDTRTRLHVQVTMSDSVARLKTDCERFVDLAKQLNYQAQEALSREVHKTEMTRVETDLPDTTLPTAVLSDAELFGPIVILGIGGTVIGIGIDILLATTLGIILAPLILVFGKVIYDMMKEQIGDNPRRRMAEQIQRSVQNILLQIEPQLAENIQNAWDALCRDLEVKLNPYERSLRTYRSVTARMDSGIRQRHLDLLKQLHQIDDLQEDLHNSTQYHDEDGMTVHD